ncbi:hypothetical protein SCHPADRAFT_988883 [Schizopora paradoxa]|uniref:Uncharacterized protein n=1 Tax=Schizopora paradoxa TaxID=27342 RepID=A0A0H2R029_9AGAM|nr:hypothetical protein SCHPADRAFT_988883 [Schizopora paradoxa]
MHINCNNPPQIMTRTRDRRGGMTGGAGWGGANVRLRLCCRLPWRLRGGLAAGAGAIDILALLLPLVLLLLMGGVTRLDSFLTESTTNNTPVREAIPQARDAQDARTSKADPDLSPSLHLSSNSTNEAAQHRRRWGRRPRSRFCSGRGRSGERTPTGVPRRKLEIHGRAMALNLALASWWDAELVEEVLFSFSPPSPVVGAITITPPHSADFRHPISFVRGEGKEEGKEERLTTKNGTRTTQHQDEVQTAHL